MRTAVRRAYYYVYHLALVRAQSHGFKALSGGVHTQWKLFALSPEPDCQRLALIAERMKRKRERADYKSIYARVEDEVAAPLADARVFASLLSGISSRHPDPKSVGLG